MQVSRSRGWRERKRFRGEHTFRLLKDTKEGEEAAPHAGGAKQAKVLRNHGFQASTFPQELR